MTVLRRAFATCLAGLTGLGIGAANAAGVWKTAPEVRGEAILVQGEGATVYVASPAENRVTQYNVNGDSISHIAVGPAPRYLALDARCAFDGSCGDLYVSNTGDGTLTVRRGSQGALSTIAIGGAGPVIADGGKAYVLRLGPNGGVTIVDGTTLARQSIDTGPVPPTAFTIAAGRLYVSFADSGEVRVIDPAAPTAPARSLSVPGRPGPIGYNPETQRVYVLRDDAAAPIVEIDASTHAIRAFSLQGRGHGPRAISADGSVIYAGFADGLVLVDARSRNVTTIPTAEVVSIAHDRFSRQAFILDASRTLTMVRDADKYIESTRIPIAAAAVAFSFKGCAAVVAGPAGSTVVSFPCSDFDVSGISAQGLWWTLGGAESGWGLNIAHQGTKLFATWFTYDAQGRNTWLVMSDSLDIARNTYEGTLYRTSGPAFGAPFDPARVTRTPVGKLQIRLFSTDNALLTATVDGVTVSKTLSQQQFALPMPICAKDATPGSIPNYQDLWWNSSESGWGLNITHQGDTLFVTWFTYDGNGQPMWLVGSNVAKTGNATYSGTLYRTAGPSLAASPWEPSRVSRAPAGTATLTFSDSANGTFTYTVDGVSASKAVTRQAFASPATVCK